MEVLSLFICSVLCLYALINDTNNEQVYACEEETLLFFFSLVKGKERRGLKG